MAISCPTCKRIFSDEKSYQNHLPCHSTTVGGKEDLGEAYFGQEVQKTEGGTGER